jgi:glyoxylase-like metal-dependent hydrolase (beta-lactamase superfamily II)
MPLDNYPVAAQAAVALRCAGRKVATVGNIPESARGPARDLSGGLAVEQIGDRLFLVTDGDYQAMVADTGEGIVAFDAPWGEEYLAAIRRVSPAPVTHVVYSHSHYDHIGGASHLGAAVVVAHRATAEILRRHADHRRPVPTVTFDREMTLDAGPHSIELRYHGPNHQDGNIFIHLPQQRVLMLVDVVVPGWVPFHALGGATDVAGYLDAHDTALSYPFDTLVAGHLTRTGTARDVHIQREYLDDVRRACTQARHSVNPGDIAAATGTDDKWQFASTYFDHLAVIAASEVLPRWVNRLGGAAAFTHSHCPAMTIALAHEWGVDAG